jgi:hypothetical protein
MGFYQALATTGNYGVAGTVTSHPLYFGEISRKGKAVSYTHLTLPTN